MHHLKMRLAVCLAALLLAGLTSASGDSVRHLTTSDFEETTGDGKVWFIKMYAPWCGHCKRMAPAWAELAVAYKDSSEVGIASVDCTKQKAVCDKADVKGFPTLKVFQGGEGKQVYRGARAFDDLKTFVEAQKHLLQDLTTA